jgi:hypothetical protein
MATLGPAVPGQKWAVILFASDNVTTQPAHRSALVRAVGLDSALDAAFGLRRHSSCTTLSYMKTSVYSWRVSSQRKAALEEVARKRNKPVAELLDEAVDRWLGEQDNQEDEEARQQRLHAAAASAFGRVAGGDPNRAERARATIRAKLRERRSSRR